MNMEAGIRTPQRDMLAAVYWLARLPENSKGDPPLCIYFTTRAHDIIVNPRRMDHAVHTDELAPCHEIRSPFPLHRPPLSSNIRQIPTSISDATHRLSLPQTNNNPILIPRTSLPPRRRSIPIPNSTSRHNLPRCNIDRCPGTDIDSSKLQIDLHLARLVDFGAWKRERICVAGVGASVEGTGFVVVGEEGYGVGAVAEFSAGGSEDFEGETLVRC